MTADFTLTQIPPKMPGSLSTWKFEANTPDAQLVMQELIEELRTRIQIDYSEADQALNALHALLNGKLKLGLALDRKAPR